MINANKINLRELKIGQEVKGLLLITSCEVKTGKNGAPYHELTLTDGDMQIVARDFNNLCVLDKGDVAYILLRAEEFAGRISYRVDKIDSNAHNEDLPVGNFVRKAPLDENEMYHEILKRLEGLVKYSDADYSIAQVGVDIYKENQEKLLYWSAARGMHHNFYGGLLYHTYRMMNLAEGYLQAYPKLNRELLLTAVAIHDIGKLEELHTDLLGTAEYTTAGEMLGHAVLGMQMIDAAAKDKNYDPEMLMCLKHCVASHHGNLEWDAIVVPKFQEAFVLHMIDMADSRIYMYENNYAGLEPGTHSQKRDLGLETTVYRPSFS